MGGVIEGQPHSVAILSQLWVWLVIARAGLPVRLRLWIPVTPDEAAASCAQQHEPDEDQSNRQGQKQAFLKDIVLIQLSTIEHLLGNAGAQSAYQQYEAHYQQFPHLTRRFDVG